MTTVSVLRRWRQRVLAVAAAIALMAGLGACGAGRGVLGTSAGPCFIALPVAKRAVEGRGKLAGIRLVDPATLTARDDRALRGLLDSLPVRPVHDVCLIAYVGRFTPGQVELAGQYPPGLARFAIAVVAIPHPRLLGTILVRHVPMNFSHGHVYF
jgi:hypothetical protein